MWIDTEHGDLPITMSTLRRGATAAATTSPALSQSAPPGSRPRTQSPDDGNDNSELRPRTCPVLTSQFHWNLNAHAVESLAEDELAQAYRLFRFYDSSTVGDSLPSISCRRLLQLLSDGGLLLQSTGSMGLPPSLQSFRGLAATIEEPGSMRLDVTAVEKIFAEVVMGKLRTYFDADGQPMLTFHLFCGALLNCAMTIFPKHKLQPEVAMMKLLEKLLKSVDQYADERQCEPRRSRSLLQHFPREGPSALWLPDEAHGAVALMPSSTVSGDDSDHGRKSDFRALKPFQQVLSSFSVDVAIESRARERAQQEYATPADLAAHFTPENLALVVQRFKLFDVFDRGTLPRQEILPLLTGLVKKLEITDMYEVLTLLLTGEHVSRYGKGSVLSSESSHTTASTAEISLTEILRAIHACRRSRTASSYGSSGGSHTAAVRKATGNPSHKPLIQSGAETRGNTDIQASLKVPAESNYEDDGEVSSLEGGELSGNKRATKDRKPLRKSKASGSFSQQLTSTKQSAGAKNGSTSSEKKPSSQTKKASTESHRKQSALHKDQDIDGAGARPSAVTRWSSRSKSKMAMFLDGTSADSESADSGENTNELAAEPRLTADNRDFVDHGKPVSDSMDRRDSFKNLLSVASASHSVAFPEKPGITMVPSTRLDSASTTPVTGVTAKSSTESRTRSVRVFMLLGGDHDGAICYAVELILPQRKVEETRGVFYRNGSHEVLERSPVLPVQPDAESALLMLKKCIQQRLREGFTLYPRDQLMRVDTMLTEIRQSNPHYQSPLRGFHHHDDSTSAFRVPVSGPTATTPNRVDLSTRYHHSLDRTVTRVRQTSTSDLLVGLSDAFTNQSLREKTHESMRRSRGGGTTPCYGTRRQAQDQPLATPTEALSGDLGWIRMVNDANRTRSTQRIQSSASTPSLSNSRQQTHGSLKP